MNVKPTILVSYGTDGYKVEYVGDDAQVGVQKLKKLKEQASPRSLLLFIRPKPDKRYLTAVPSTPIVVEQPKGHPALKRLGR